MRDMSTLLMPRLFAAGSLALIVLIPGIRTRSAEPATERVRTGLEVLLTDSLHLVQGKRVGVITNQTGIDPLGRSTVDRVAAAPGVRLTAIFAPEHGFRGVAAAGAHIANERDSTTGVPIYSLYGSTKVPTAEMLRDVDVLLYDIQDVGARVYTYPWTMALSAEAGGKPFIVLDRPNPI